MTPQPITHHIDDALLMAYSAGTLPEAFSLAIATHISMCDECRATLESFDAVGGQVMEDQSPVTMNDDSFAKTMAMVGKQSIQRPKPATISPLSWRDILADHWMMLNGAPLAVALNKKSS